MKGLKIKQVAERSTTMKGFGSLAVVCVVTAGILCSGCASPDMAKIERNKALVRGMFMTPMSEYRAVVQKYLAPEYLWHQPGEAKPLDRDGAEKFFAGLNNAFPDLRATIDDMVGEGDKVVTRFTMHGTHKGAFMGMPATGKEVTVSGISISRIKDGKIVEEWEEDDSLGLMTQIGAISFKK
jgi:steroid delta-isomerase-like uncharacterized protein